MADMKKIAPFAYGFCKDLTLELPERIGLAILEGAKHIDISFGRTILPFGSLSTCVGGAFFNFATSLTCEYEMVEELLEKYPENAEEINGYLSEFTQYNSPMREHRNQTEFAMTVSDAIHGQEWEGHSNPDFGRVVNIGTEGIRELIEKGRRENPGRDAFYNGCSYTMDALDVLGDRFRELAAKLAIECENEADKKRYELAAKAFEVIPRKPAYDFTSAVHAFWLTFCFEGYDSPGRFDQYMYRAYSASDNREETLDILERLWETFHDTRTWNLCLSGSDANWNDETNELTYDILALAAKKKYQTPNITLRVHRNTPEKLWNAIHETLATGIGMPALYNDEIVCPAFEKVGVLPEDSHDYCMNGCNQIDIMGKSHMGLEDGEVILPKCLEYALYNGKNPVNGNVDSIRTGDVREFKTYEQFERAVYRQLEFVTNTACQSANGFQQKRANYRPNPYRSCLIEGCLERGIDYRNGGPLYGHGQMLAEGIADAGDSMWAIKKLVFDEKKYTMATLMDALDADFEGYDELYRDFSSCEKFGNDIEEVDNVTAGLLNRFFAVLKNNRTYRGGVYMGGCSPFNRAAHHGRNIGALPNGKKRCHPLIADAIGATPGRDVNGPTSLLKSALKYDHIESGSGFVLMVKFDKKVFASEKGKEAFKVLAKTYFAGGGQQFTVSVVSHEELLDAIEHPEDHRDLIVRVGGYSDYFVNIERGLQENVIARTVLDI